MKMTNMEMSILEAGGLTGRVYNTKTHSITPKEHRAFLKLQESWRKEKEEKSSK